MRAIETTGGVMDARRIETTSPIPVGHQGRPMIFWPSDADDGTWTTPRKTHHADAPRILNRCEPGSQWPKVTGCLTGRLRHIVGSHSSGSVD